MRSAHQNKSGAQVYSTAVEVTLRHGRRVTLDNVPPYFFCFTNTLALPEEMVLLTFT